MPFLQALTSLVVATEKPIRHPNSDSPSAPSSSFEVPWLACLPSSSSLAVAGPALNLGPPLLRPTIPCTSSRLNHPLQRTSLPRPITALPIVILFSSKVSCTTASFRTRPPAAPTLFISRLNVVLSSDSEPPLISHMPRIRNITFSQLWPELNHGRCAQSWVMIHNGTPPERNTSRPYSTRLTAHRGAAAASPTCSIEYLWGGGLHSPRAMVPNVPQSTEDRPAHDAERRAREISLPAMGSSPTTSKRSISMLLNADPTPPSRSVTRSPIQIPPSPSGRRYDPVHNPDMSSPVEMMASSSSYFPQALTSPVLWPHPHHLNGDSPSSSSSSAPRLPHLLRHQRRRRLDWLSI
ncbi:hypothetical protein DL93DRAFT_2233791 [Clavulina sp. PMI_390]|nr:hypothetical protein DL93DRAFT_2233791 [Clavulina sp. PMI_390]